MKRSLIMSAAGLLTILWACQATADGVAKKKPISPIASEAATCGDHGTSVHFEANPSAAAKKALKEEKLVLVLHISGLFENSDFT